MKVTVTEGKHRKVNFGVGYGSEEKGRGLGRLAPRQFLRRRADAAARRQLLGAQQGGRGALPPAVLLRPAQQPAVDRAVVAPQRTGLHADTKGGRAIVQHILPRPGPFSQRTAGVDLSVAYINEFQSYQVSDEALHTPGFIKTLIALGLDPLNGQRARHALVVRLRRDASTTDSTVNAKRGYMVDGHVEKATRILSGDFRFTKRFSRGATIQPLADRALVAVKVRGGSIGSFGDENLGVPFYRRYWLGGADSLRGWGRFEVSPLFDGVPIGGHTMIQSSLEMRVPIWGNLARRGVRRCRQRLEQRVGLQPERPAL